MRKLSNDTVNHMVQDNWIKIVEIMNQQKISREEAEKIWLDKQGVEREPVKESAIQGGKSIGDEIYAGKLTSYTIKESDVGRLLETGFGRVQKIDVGKKCYIRNGIFQMENVEQRDKRLKGGMKPLTPEQIAKGKQALARLASKQMKVLAQRKSVEARSDFPAPGQIESIISQGASETDIGAEAFIRKYVNRGVAWFNKLVEYLTTQGEDSLAQDIKKAIGLPEFKTLQATKQAGPVYNIGQGGLTRIKKGGIHLQPNHDYYLGSSSSPKHIFVTEVTEDFIMYSPYPFTGTYKLERPVADGGIAQGTRTWVDSYGQYYPDEVKDFELLLSGKPSPVVQKFEDFQYVTLLLRPAPGADHDDFYTDAKSLGVVGGMHVNTGELTIDIQRMNVSELLTSPNIELVKELGLAKMGGAMNTKRIVAGETYEGWKNRETWALVLWINNDQALHSLLHDEILTVVSDAPSLEDAVTRAWEDGTIEDLVGADTFRSIQNDVGSFWRVDWQEVWEYFSSKTASKSASKVSVEDADGKPVEIENPYYDIPSLDVDTVASLKQYDIEDLKEFGEDDYRIIVDTIVSSDYGMTGPTVVLRNLGLIPEEAPADRDDEWDSDWLEDVYSAITDDINSQTTLSGTYYCGWEEGGFYLFFTFSDEDAIKLGLKEVETVEIENPYYDIPSFEATPEPENKEE